MRELVDTYEFEALGGSLLFRKLRYRLTDGSKAFRYECNCSGRWRGHKPGPQAKGCKADFRADDYILNLPRVGGTGRVIWWTEGEKDARTLGALGALATSTHQGASGGVTRAQAGWLAGAKGVWVCLDNDVPGAKHAWDRYVLLREMGVRVRFVLPGLELPAADITDHFSAGMNKNELIEPPAEWVEEQAAKYTPSVGRRYGYEVA